jgi:DNA polymerase I-like protein with 3'-5' exonuclease and polymerase domains
LVATKNYDLVKDLDQLTKLIDRIIVAAIPFGLDIETGYEGQDKAGASLHPDEPVCKLVGISFTNSIDWARYVSLGHDFGPNLDGEECARLFWKLCKTGKCVAHNAKFELRHLRRWFLEMLPDDEEVVAANGYFPMFSDTMIEAYIEATQPSLGLKTLTKELFGYDQAELASLFPKVSAAKAKAIRFNILELIPQVVAYACEDAAWCLQIHQLLYPKVKDKLLYKVEMQVLPRVEILDDSDSAALLLRQLP